VVLLELSYLSQLIMYMHTPLSYSVCSRLVGFGNRTHVEKVED
jgi:hypothetical protein